jgi:hypothetical protein
LRVDSQCATRRGELIAGVPEAHSIFAISDRPELWKRSCAVKLGYPPPLRLPLYTLIFSILEVAERGTRLGPFLSTRAESVRFSKPPRYLRGLAALGHILDHTGPA